MKINYKIKDLCLSEDLEELFCEIDKKIANLSKKKLNSVRYAIKETSAGCGSKINTKAVSQLVRYREILLAKTKDLSCLSKYTIDSIITRIKKILNNN